MQLHQLSPLDALASLHGRVEGLDQAEAIRRRAEVGPNEVEAMRGRPRWLVFLREFTHFFALILWCAAGLAGFAEWRQPGEGMATLAIAIVCVILINGSFSFWQEYKAERALTALQQLLPHRVRLLRESQTVEVDASELVPGDIVFLQEGDRVPADARLLESFGLQVNNSTLTGESVSRSRSALADPVEDPHDAHNLVFAGTAVVTGEGRAIVFATGPRSEFGQIARLTQTAGETVSPLVVEVQRLSRILVTIAGSLGVLFFVLGSWIGLSWWSALIFGIGIIVANVPEGLLPTLTLSLAMAAQRMAKRNALVRHLPAVETLGCTTIICTDKTGTLTRNQMEVQALVFADAEWSAEALLAASDLSAPALAGRELLLTTLALCHGLKRSQAGWLGDPMEVALAEYGERGLGQRSIPPRLDEVAFDSSRKRMSVLHRLPEGRRLFTKGALETTLHLCAHAWSATGRVDSTEPIRAAVHTAAEALADRGLRVLVLAYREVAETETEPGQSLREDSLTFLGLVGLEDPPRAEVPDAIARCFAAGIRVLMVTGDGPRTAEAIARQIGLVSSPTTVITGERLQRLSPAELQLELDTEALIFARVSPEQKLRIVTALQAKQHVVAVTGDGVNDAPALKRADIGIAMGKSGTDVAREAADIVLLDDNFASIVAAIEEGRSIFDNLRKFLTYILASNVPELVPYLAYVLLQIPLPLTIIQILAVDLGTDMVPALALGAEKPDPEVMHRPPRPRSERLLSGAVLARAYGFLGVLEAAAALTVFFFVLDGLGWTYGEVLPSSDHGYRMATTGCLIAIVVAQIANVFACRSSRRSAFDRAALANRFLLGALGFEMILILLIVYTPVGQRMFATAAVPANVWALAGGLAIGLLLAEELRKVIARRVRGAGR